MTYALRTMILSHNTGKCNSWDPEHAQHDYLQQVQELGLMAQPYCLLHTGIDVEKRTYCDTCELQDDEHCI